MIHCDVAIGDDLAEVGFIIRDHWGKPLLVGGKWFSTSCESMELQAILEALDVVRCSFPQFHAIEIHTDSALAAQEMHCMLQCPPEGGFLSTAIVHAPNLVVLRVAHVRCECNAPVDWAARTACLGDYAWGRGMPLLKPLLKLLLDDFLFDPL
ncbi:hypothetical protein HPP92_007496 [Vanilla planifolia]|uniref:RNase H type-1 domain-containing protein n=1 Tax=Vanilla planifolia TaxID=51239 RepID=A0A835RIB8_VANPL|nr:hypothetical protein HPP92_007496 [Vanilla planifolia]